MSLVACALIVFVPMLIEALRAAANERVQRARGGIEPADDIYPAIRIAYPSAFLAMLVELALRGTPGSLVFAAGNDWDRAAARRRCVP